MTSRFNAITVPTLIDALRLLFIALCQLLIIMNRRTAIAAVFTLTASLFSGCKSMSSNTAGDDSKKNSEEGMFSKLRQSDADSDYSGLSSKSREIEKNLGVGRE